MGLKFARNYLNHIPPYSQCSLYFQCLKRLHHAFEETFQALFIAARRYPIAYDKWIEEQVSEILGRTEFYTFFVQVVPTGYATRYHQADSEAERGFWGRRGQCVAY